MELLIILALILLFFGARRVPQLGRAVGSGVREFRKQAAASGPADDKQELERDDGDEEEGPPPDDGAAARGRTMPRAEREDGGTPSVRRKPPGG